MTDDNLTTIISFISNDDNDITAEELMKIWPHEPQNQTLVLAMLTVRNNREIYKNRRNSTALWYLVTISLSLGVVSAAKIFGLDLQSSILASVITGACAQLLKLGIN